MSNVDESGDVASRLEAANRANMSHLRAVGRYIELKLRLLLLPDFAPADAGLLRRLFRWRKRDYGNIKAKEELERLTAAAARLVEQCESSLPPRLVHLCGLFGVQGFQKQLLMLCVAAEMNQGVAALCGMADPKRGRNEPTLALAHSLFPDEFEWSALSPVGPLRHWRLVEVDRAAGEPSLSAPLRMDERIMDFIRGVDVPDVVLVGIINDPPSGTEEHLSDSQRIVATALSDRLTQSNAAGVFQLINADGNVARSVASLAVKTKAVDLPLRQLRIELLPTGASEIESITRAWRRDQRIYPAALFIDASDIDLNAERSASLASFVTQLGSVGGPCFVACREPRKLGEGAVVVIVPNATVKEQKETWEARLGDYGSALAGELASQFSLKIESIQQIADDTTLYPSDSPTEVNRKIGAAVFQMARPKLEGLAKEIQPKARLDDVVLPEYQTKQLVRLTEQVRWRSKVYQEWGVAERLTGGLGITALFCGESGTGKSMAAEAIAKDLGQPLFQVDLSCVVSKYIGETEKQIAKLFEAADHGCMLHFEEADALFGNRTEVRDSHDRYANVEVNYLLQRMESFSGVAILSTNRKADLDGAFLRRLRLVVDFPLPGKPERLKIWKRLLRENPGEQDVPTRDLDYDRLAAINLVGGHIHNIAMDAAFRAAAAHSDAIDMSHVLAAARDELLKLGRAVKSDDFVWKAQPIPKSTGALLPPTGEAAA